MAEVTFGGDAHHVLHVLLIYWLFERNVIMAEDIRIAEILPRLGVGMSLSPMPLPVSLDKLLTGLAPSGPLSVDLAILVHPNPDMLALDVLPEMVGAHGLEVRVFITMMDSHIFHDNFFSVFGLYFIII